MSNNPAFDLYAQSKRNLDLILADLATKRAWLRLRASEDWSVLATWFAAQIHAKHQEVAGDSELSLNGFHALRAEIRLLQRLMRAGDVDPGAIEELEKKAQGLRDHIRLCETRGFNVDYQSQASTK